MINRAVAKSSPMDRISLNLTVPKQISGEAWNHLLASVERFEKSKSISVVDLDMRRAPIEPIDSA